MLKNFASIPLAVSQKTKNVPSATLLSKFTSSSFNFNIVVKTGIKQPRSLATFLGAMN